MSKIAVNTRTGRPIAIGETVMRVKRSKFGRYTRATVRGFPDPEAGIVLLEFKINDVKETYGLNYGIVFREADT